MRNINAPLFLGGAIVLALIVMAIFAPQLAPRDPHDQSYPFFMKLENGEILTPPFPPTPAFPLGSDNFRRDLLSRAIYGSRFTLAFCASVLLVRMGLGVLLGSLAGWNNHADRLISAVAAVYAGLPSIIFALLLIIVIGFFESPQFRSDVPGIIFREAGLRGFIIALSLTGWAEISQNVRNYVVSIKGRPYIEGAVAVGLRPRQILWRYVLPQIAPALMVLAALEMSAILLTVAELGFLGFYIGGGRMEELATGGWIKVNVAPEWGAMLADTRRWIFGAPWMPLVPAVAFAIAILGFNLLGEGLRRQIDPLLAREWA